MVDQRAGAVLREARRRAALSQVQLAQRAGTTQSVVSAYESAARQPSLPMLARLVSASGLELDVRVRSSRAPARGRGPLLERLETRRREIKRVAARHGISNLRVFGSVARGDETEESDIDLLVDVAPDVGLFELARCRQELESLLQAQVDLVPAVDLKDHVARSAHLDARRL